MFCHGLPYVQLVVRVLDCSSFTFFRDRLQYRVLLYIHRHRPSNRHNLFLAERTRHQKGLLPFASRSFPHNTVPPCLSQRRLSPTMIGEPNTNHVLSRLRVPKWRNSPRSCNVPQSPRASTLKEMAPGILDPAGNVNPLLRHWVGNSFLFMISCELSYGARELGSLSGGTDY